MASGEFRSAREKATYFRLLRHVIGRELKTAYKADQSTPLSPSLLKILKAIEDSEPSKAR